MPNMQFSCCQKKNEISLYIDLHRTKHALLHVNYWVKGTLNLVLFKRFERQNICILNVFKMRFFQIRIFFVKTAQNLATAPVCKQAVAMFFVNVLSRICDPKQRFTGFEVFLGCQIFRKQKGK